VVQLYVAAPQAAHEPPRQLKGYAKVSLDGGHSGNVTFRLARDDLAYFDQDLRRWSTAAGRYVAFVGFSSRDLQQSATFDIDH
jgi:beta-glucosidase